MVSRLVTLFIYDALPVSGEYRAPVMCSSVTALLAASRSSFRTRAELEAEILALRHQLAVLQQVAPRRLRLSRTDRLFLGAALARLEWLAGGRANRETRDRRLLASPPVRLALALAFRATPSWSPSDPRPVRKTRPMEPRGLAVVELERAAEALTTRDLACSDHCCLRR
jgi:hypothetical protein